MELFFNFFFVLFYWLFYGLLKMMLFFLYFLASVAVSSLVLWKTASIARVGDHTFKKALMTSVKTNCAVWILFLLLMFVAYYKPGVGRIEPIPAWNLVCVALLGLLLLLLIIQRDYKIKWAKATAIWSVVGIVQIIVILLGLQLTVWLAWLHPINLSFLSLSATRDESGATTPQVDIPGSPEDPDAYVPMFKGNLARTGAYDAEGVPELSGLLWDFPMNARGELGYWYYVGGEPAISKDVLYAAGIDFNLYALDAKTGAERW